jgi:hypothetical protein
MIADEQIAVSSKPMSKIRNGIRRLGIMGAKVGVLGS